MRPRGEIRLAVASAATSLYEQRGSFTGPDVAGLAQVAYEKTRRTLHDMARAGEIEKVDQLSVPGVCRPLNVYTLAKPEPAGDEQHVGVRQVMARSFWERPVEHDPAQCLAEIR